MNLNPCDCCGRSFKELNHATVGAKRTEWLVCADCLNHQIPRIPATADVPLLSCVFDFAPHKKDTPR